jgi:two-component system chemotaxis response regulator CheB
MRDAGAPTIAQDEATSVVWGMPGAAVRLGGVTDVMPLEKIASAIMRLADDAEAQDIDVARLQKSGA